ncbi:hypothetical protein EXIGLDRAFT_281826 [Exidia glandulosa HHB12029]|uniref:Uncharacterized protein n=1 Tax=Exidia glandulosa HHB12029 TaxID=1314781 RepID=A0A165DIW1_EXIGL|nr:hypothetical protein EXIGLDRAFT_281826 [Exidia glandulosa HHB12029]
MQTIADTVQLVFPAPSILSTSFHTVEPPGLGHGGSSTPMHIDIPTLSNGHAGPSSLVRAEYELGRVADSSPARATGTFAPFSICRHPARPHRLVRVRQRVRALAPVRETESEAQTTLATPGSDPAALRVPPLGRCGRQQRRGSDTVLDVQTTRTSVVLAGRRAARCHCDLQMAMRRLQGVRGLQKERREGHHLRTLRPR